MAEKAKYWSGVLYPENMIENWREEIAHIIQVPCEYCLHDKDMIDEQGNPKVNDKGEQRKEHLHVTLAFPNTTTKNYAMSVLNKLSKDGLKCCSTIESVNSIAYMHNYLIHDTEDARKKHKYQYDASERISCNGFDIGSYIQIGIKEKREMTKELCDVIIQNDFTNFADFYMFVSTNFDSEYFEILMTHSGLFERISKGNYQKHLVMEQGKQ